MDLHAHLIEAWDCAFGDNPVVYLSGPITTGQKFVDRVRSGVSENEAKKELLHVNCEALKATASELRRQKGLTVVEPASLNVRDWSQADYLELWKRFIGRHVRLIMFMSDWQYSIGCATEFEKAVAHDIRTETVSGSLINPDDGVALLISARDDLLSDDASGALSHLAHQLDVVIGRLQAELAPAKIPSSQELRKDASLNYLAEQGMNVAQFVSFLPTKTGPFQEYSRVAGCQPNLKFKDLQEAVVALLNASTEHSVNVRSYEPFNPQSREFVYGLTSVDDAVSAVTRLTAEGLHTIVNETVNIHDGGVSGVLMGNILEFAPDDTPRCVEKPGTASLPRGWGRELLSSVYRFPAELNVPLGSRLEFSLHPQPRGWRQTNVLVWEFAEHANVDAKAQLQWPNQFSRMIGDKTFGLLVAHHIGLPVPKTTVVNRRVAPFSFGQPTNSGETWIRTAPLEQEPGKYTTHRGWIDPYVLLNSEDPAGKNIVAVLAQDGVRPVYSGALIVGAQGAVIIEGKQGEGESLMLGASSPEEMPLQVTESVNRLFEHAHAALGPVRLEWVFDGVRAWVVQLHRGATETDATRLTKLEANRWIPFDVAQGLEALRLLIAELDEGTGIELHGRVGLTSHIADVVRKASVPARMVS